MARQLAARFHLSASPSDVVFIDAPPRLTNPWQHSRAWALAQHPGQHHDVYLLHVRRTPEGAVLSVDAAYNLTDTRGTDETDFRAAGTLAAWTTGRARSIETASNVESIHLADARSGADAVLDTAPESDAPIQRVTDAFTKTQRWQLRISWWQQTGQLSGVAQRQFRLDPPAEQVWLKLEPEALRIWADGREARLARLGPPLEGGRHLAEQPRHVSRPGNLVTWAVDRARYASWFGDEKLQIIKAIAYRALDRFELLTADLRSSQPDEEETLMALPPAPTAQAQQAKPIANPGVTPSAAANTDWPPPPLSPVLDPPAEHEGEWQSLERDYFVRSLPDSRSVFYTTFIRTDRDRRESRVLITLWDARLVELSMQAGTEEPKPATEVRGSGLVPRDPDVMERFVAAFNGGFQGTHGDFGMMVERTEIVPPKPFAATVARLADGRVGFGTWPRELDVPAELVSFRQNLTPLVMDGVTNPYGRLWWGGVPEGWTDDTRTVRSGLCHTRRGHVAYFYGAKVDHEHLAKAMQAADCDYGMHLDMNQGHTGLEFYHVARSHELPTLGLPLDGMWQAEGEVEGLPGYRFRGRRLFKAMQLMNFPRYIQRESRDFFYLTLRQRLPGKPLLAKAENAAQAETGEGTPAPLGPDEQWQFRGLPAQSYPYAIMRATLRPDPAARPENKVHLLKIDPELVEPLPSDTAREPLFRFGRVPGTEPAALEQPGKHLVWTNGTWQFDPGDAASGAVSFAVGAREPTNNVRAALGIDRSGGFLLYAEVATDPRPAEDAKLLGELLQRAGCEEVLFLSERIPVELAEARDLSGHLATLAGPVLAWGVRAVTGSRRIFSETQIVPRAVWRPLQQSEAAKKSH